MTPEEYLVIEREAEYKSEYYRGEMLAMPSSNANHSRIAVRVAAALSDRIDSGLNWAVYNSDLRVRTEPGGLYTYPDISIVCGKPMFTDDQRDVLTNPRLILEVLSPSTEVKDRGFKFRQYKAIPTLEEYVLVSQSEALLEGYGRQPGGEWRIYPEASGLDAVFQSRALGIEIPLAQIYRGIDFEA